MANGNGKGVPPAPNQGSVLRRRMNSSLFVPNKLEDSLQGNMEASEQALAGPSTMGTYIRGWVNKLQLFGQAMLHPYGTVTEEEALARQNAVIEQQAVVDPMLESFLSKSVDDLKAHTGVTFPCGSDTSLEQELADLLALVQIEMDLMFGVLTGDGTTEDDVVAAQADKEAAAAAFEVSCDNLFGSNMRGLVPTFNPCFTQVPVGVYYSTPLPG